MKDEKSGEMVGFSTLLVPFPGILFYISTYDENGNRRRVLLRLNNKESNGIISSESTSFTTHLVSTWLHSTQPPSLKFSSEAQNVEGNKK